MASLLCGLGEEGEALGGLQIDCLHGLGGSWGVGIGGFTTLALHEEVLHHLAVCAGTELVGRGVETEDGHHVSIPHPVDACNEGRCVLNPTAAPLPAFFVCL